MTQRLRGTAAKQGQARQASAEERDGPGFGNTGNVGSRNVHAATARGGGAERVTNLRRAIRKRLHGGDRCGNLLLIGPDCVAIQSLHEAEADVPQGDQRRSSGVATVGETTRGALANQDGAKSAGVAAVAKVASDLRQLDLSQVGLLCAQLVQGELIIHVAGDLQAEIHRRAELIGEQAAGGGDALPRVERRGDERIRSDSGSVGNRSVVLGIRGGHGALLGIQNQAVHDVISPSIKIRLSGAEPEIRSKSRGYGNNRRGEAGAGQDQTQSK